MRELEPFLLERWQSENEHDVAINLSDSGVHPLTLRELFDERGLLEGVLDERLIYTQTNGTPELRGAVAALHPGAREANVLATNGGAEANLVAALHLVEPGDHVVAMLPNYMQLVGLVRGLGGRVDPWTLRPDFGQGAWTADLAELEQLVTPRTKLVAICNPNNPTGARLSGRQLDEICRIADRSGAWVLSDEIYRGAEVEGDETETIWGRGEHVLVTSSLSKAYGLPGLRLGWVVAPPRLTRDLWGVRDYTTIAPGALSDLVGRLALQEPWRSRVLARTRRLLGANLDLVASWVGETEGVRAILPRAGAILFARYDHPVPSSELVQRLRAEKDVLLVPGSHFGMEGWLRIGFGGERRDVEEGLGRLSELLREVGDAGSPPES